ncbi:glycoside hydrolase family 43 protein [Pontiellaceae bacterium B1224]|nr:glycoside hydrolase family 43 protein [Pontiellaceae bacterium B1224]
MIQNPILRGFNPDPSILRVGDDYYIATSTFEWFPGVPIYHSKDLKNWKLLCFALNRISQIDLRGVDTAKGVWAPCLSRDEKTGLFYLVYTNVYGYMGQQFDLDNFIVTAENIEGPWSEPRYVNSSGFDPSLFHDDDGRKWVLNLDWEPRPGYEQPGWIVLQEWDDIAGKLIGRPVRITNGITDRGCVEAPHLYRHNGFYYLMTAEGGTGYGHAVVMARAENIEGPYEPDPQGPLITSQPENFNARHIIDCERPNRYNPDSILQKSGHGSLVETQNGEWFVPHLCSRPLLPELRCPLGRETAIQKCVWNADGWLRMADGSNLAKMETAEADLPEHAFEPLPIRDEFDGPELNMHFQSYRIPMDGSWVSFERPGFLRLRGQGSIFSPRHMSLVARRIQAFSIRAETCVEFEPWNHHQSAGLVAFYSQHNFYYLRIYRSESLGGKCLAIMKSDCGEQVELKETRVRIAKSTPVYLRMETHTKELQFSYSLDGSTWSPIGPLLDMGLLSDEYGFIKFTGAFAGLFVQDVHTQELCADFDYFDYEERV